MEQIENRKIVTGVIREVSHVSIPAQYYIHYSYECNGQNYLNKWKLPIVKDTSVFHILPQKKISIAVSTKDCDFSYPIVTTTDLDRFKIEKADSLKQFIIAVKENR